MPFFVKTEKFTQKTMDLSLEERKKYLSDHKSWVEKLKKSGVNISSGYLINHAKEPGGGGILILESQNFDQARNLILKDPMIRNNLVNWNLNEWISVVGSLLNSDI